MTAALAGTDEATSDLLDRVEYRLVETEAAREEILRLRYDAYLHEGAIAPSESTRLADRFEDAPNAWTFGVYVDGALASSIRISVATPDFPDSPAVDAFADLLKPELGRGKTIVDPNRFVADPRRAVRIPALPYLTVRLGYVACEHFMADIGTATVRAEHRAFYRRVFMMAPRCAPRPYPLLLKPLGLMTADYPLVRQPIFQRYPYFRSTLQERCRLFARPALQAPIVPRPESQSVNIDRLDQAAA